MFSQGEEEAVILDYFGDYTGHLVDIGANDGVTFSNSRQLILNGWTADLFEPNPEAYNKLEKLYKSNDSVETHNLAISSWQGEGSLWVNEPHVDGDIGLLSTLNESELKRWKGIHFEETKVKVIKWPEIGTDFLTIDIEGGEIELLPTIDLNEIGCLCLCVEWNGKNGDFFHGYAKDFGMKRIHLNGENLIFAK